MEALGGGAVSYERGTPVQEVVLLGRSLGLKTLLLLLLFTSTPGA